MKIPLNWGTGIAAVYALFAASTIGVVVFASGHRVDLVSDDYYAEAERFDERMTALANGRTVASDLTVALDAAREHLIITWPVGHQIDGTGTVTWYRPSSAKADRHEPLVIDADGVERLPVGGLLAGHWVVQLSWTSGGRHYAIDYPVSLP